MTELCQPCVDEGPKCRSWGPPTPLPWGGLGRCNSRTIWDPIPLDQLHAVCGQDRLLRFKIVNPDYPSVRFWVSPQPKVYTTIEIPLVKVFLPNGYGYERIGYCKEHQILVGTDLDVAEAYFLRKKR